MLIMNFWPKKSFLICKEFLTSITVFVIPRNIYLEINCVYLWSLDFEIQKFLILVFTAFSSEQPFWKCARWGSESSNFNLNITDSYYLGSKQKNICSFILWVWMTGLSIASGLCLNSLFSRIFTRCNFSPYICLYLKNVPHINLNWMQISRRQFFNSQ